MTFKKKLGEKLERVFTNRKKLINQVLEAGYQGDYEYGLELEEKQRLETAVKMAKRGMDMQTICSSLLPWKYETGVGSNELGITGRIDQVFRNKNEMIPLDFKTHTNRNAALFWKDAHFEQLAIYAMLLEMNYPKCTAKKGIIQYTEDNHNQVFNITKKDKQNVLEHINQAKRLVQIQKLPPKLEYSLKQSLKEIILPSDDEDYDMDSLNSTHSDILQDLGRYEEALDIVIPKADNVIENWKNLITRKNNDGETKFDHILRVSKDDAYDVDSGILYRQGQLFSRLGKNTEALDIFDTVLEDDPNDVNALFEKSDILQDLEKYDEALRVCEQGLKIDPDDGDLLGLKGSVLLSLKKSEEALSFFEQSIQSDSTDDVSWYNKACVLSILNKTEESLDALTVATGLDSENIILMKDEKDLDNIKNTERFKRLANQEI